MARLPRLNLPNIPQYIIQRGNNRQACFFTEKDYWVYLDKLNEYRKKFHVKIHVYVLMTNHVHLLATPETRQGGSELVQSLGRYYVRYVNQTYRRTGTLWDGRYKSTLVDAETYFLTVSRYIELNPVAANMVVHPMDYPWSSFKCNALGDESLLLSPHDIYTALGKTTIERNNVYKALFQQHISENQIIDIKNSTNKAWVLGSERFKTQIAAQTGRRSEPAIRGGDRKSKGYLESISKINQ